MVAEQFSSLHALTHGPRIAVVSRAVVIHVALAKARVIKCVEQL